MDILEADKSGDVEKIIGTKVVDSGDRHMYRFNQKKEGGCDFAMDYNGVVVVKVLPCDMFSLYKVICEREIIGPYMSERTAIIITACVTAAVVFIILLLILHFRVSF